MTIIVIIIIIMDHFQLSQIVGLHVEVVIKIKYFFLKGMKKGKGWIKGNDP